MRLFILRLAVFGAVRGVVAAAEGVKQADVPAVVALAQQVFVLVEECPVVALLLELEDEEGARAQLQRLQGLGLELEGFTWEVDFVVVGGVGTAAFGQVGH
jgi:hypothetical protein